MTAPEYPTPRPTPAMHHLSSALLLAIFCTLLVSNQCAPVAVDSNVDSIDQILFRGKSPSPVAHVTSTTMSPYKLKQIFCNRLCLRDPSKGGTICNCDSVSGKSSWQMESLVNIFNVYFTVSADGSTETRLTQSTKLMSSLHLNWNVN